MQQAITWTNAYSLTCACSDELTHWGRVTHICVSKLTITGPDNGLSPGRCQAIIWTNAGILLIGPIRTNFSEILIEILIFSFKKMRLKVSSAKRRPFCLGLNVLTEVSWTDMKGRAWINDYILRKGWDVITHPCSCINSALTKPPFKLIMDR